MEKEFVPYELAVKLKELGFDENLFYKYYYKGDIKSRIYDAQEIEYFDNKIIAPLWQQAFDWFRNKGYGAFVETWINGGVKKFRGRNNYAPLFITDVFDTYEEARKACLEKLIGICKENGLK